MICIGVFLKFPCKFPFNGHFHSSVCIRIQHWGRYQVESRFSVEAQNVHNEWPADFSPVDYLQPIEQKAPLVSMPVAEICRPLWTNNPRSSVGRGYWPRARSWLTLLRLSIITYLHHLLVYLRSFSNNLLFNLLTVSIIVKKKEGGESVSIVYSVLRSTLSASFFGRRRSKVAGIRRR